MRRTRSVRARRLAAATIVVVAVPIGVAVGQSSAPAPSPFGTPTAEQPSPGSAITAVRGARASGWQDQARSEVIARHGVVATSQPLAADAGLDVLKDGGNAVDAAVTTAAMLGVVEPYSAGIGGDALALVWSQEDRKLIGMNATGPAPAGWTPEYFAGKGYDAKAGIPRFGVDSVTAPGAVAGWDALLQRFGTIGMRRALAPAVKTAEQGFGVTERIRADWSVQESELTKDPDSARTFLRDGKAPPAYSVFRNPGLAKAYRQLQRGGADAFYRGPIGRAIVRKVRAGGGRMSMADLQRVRARWETPISTTYRDHRIEQLGPNTQGLATLQMLNVVEQCASRLGVDMRAEGPRSPRFWHLLIEAKKLAYSDLQRYVGDPRFVDVPTERLISKAYAQEQCAKIDPDRARDPSLPQGDDGGTVLITTADRWGNMVTLIYSVYWLFGSNVTVPGYGFPLHDRGNQFSLDPASPNVVAPGKRPFHTLIPGFVTKGGKPVMAFGNMGGDAQAQAQATELVNMLDLGMNVQAAGDAARFRHQQQTNVVDVEAPLYDVVGKQLEAMGHQVKRSNGEQMGGYQAILFEPDPSLKMPRIGVTKGDPPVAGVYRAGSDFRKDGAAAGW